MYKLLLFSFIFAALTFTCTRVFAEEPVFFNYALPMGPINSGAVLDFSIVHAISGEFRYRFKVRPVSDLGNTEIFDAVGGTWIP
ncbi:hypothetical protein KAZ57_03690, partial [Patescibacteria group bacterium]|nr:hypothetical protein [Patescibacteria group bacterium]